MKEFLSRTGRPFTIRDVDEDLSAYQELVARGFRSVPVTVIGETAIRGFDEPALTRALEAASTP